MGTLGCDVPCIWSSYSPGSLQIIQHARYFLKWATTVTSVNTKLQVVQTAYPKAVIWSRDLGLVIASTLGTPGSSPALGFHSKHHSPALTSQGHNWSTKCNLLGSPPPSLGGLCHWWLQRPAQHQQHFPKVPLPQGCGDTQDSVGREPMGCQGFGLGVQLINIFPHCSLGLSQHNCPTLSKQRHKTNTQKPQRFAITSQRSAIADHAAEHHNPIGCSAILAETSNHKIDIHSNQKQPTLPHC